MKKTDSQSKQKPRGTMRGKGHKDPRRFEWPLLVFPALFLATLAILHVVNRSIQEESPPPATREHPHPAGSGVTDSLVRSAGEFARHLPASSALPDGAGNRTLHNGGAAGNSGQASSVVGKGRYAVNLSQLEGPARIVALLCIAVEEEDHLGLKQRLAELVAMGDEAVAPLSRLLAQEQSEASLWAATALARIGTLHATGALLDRLTQTGEGSYKERLCKRISEIGNHDSWSLLLEIALQSNDAAVVRAAGAALSGMADAPVLNEIIARYDAASTELEIERLAQFVRQIRSPQASESLLSLAGPVTSPPQDSLQEAAIAALARVGDARCVSHLLQRLEASPPGESAQMFHTITQIDSPEAHAALLYAAAGNKEVSAEYGRTAAIYALKNYPEEQTVALLERIIAQEQNEKVLTAAARTLEEIRRGQYVLAANVESLQRSEERLPLPPLVK
ncbi:MAG: hypothetical protein FJ280_03675 [Planctomycetes bacterium]|nr:hypothetical protein [Planctomycetota bacterium]